MQEKLYMSQEDLYRVGNSSSAMLTKIRSGEISLLEMNGVKVVVANGKGVSLYNEQGLKHSALSGWVWELRSGSVLPQGLCLHKDPDPNNPGHYVICPVVNMPLHSYVGLLEKLALHCKKLYHRKKA